MTFLRRTAGRIQAGTIELNTQPIMELVDNYTSNWMNALLRNQFHTLCYEPEGRRSLDRPSKRCHKTVTGLDMNV
jgi:hypothetical protein